MPTPCDYPPGYEKDENDIEAEKAWARIQKKLFEEKKAARKEREKEREKTENDKRKTEDMMRFIRR